MALCGMEPAHKFLAFKNAMNNNYKIQNFITAAHFARLVLDLEPTGVRIFNIFNQYFSIIDICKQTRCDSAIQEIFLGIPGKRNKRLKVEFRYKSQH
jgi:hypothetical protein